MAPQKVFQRCSSQSLSLSLPLLLSLFFLFFRKCLIFSPLSFVSLKLCFIYFFFFFAQMDVQEKHVHAPHAPANATSLPRHLFKGAFIVPRGAFKNTHLKHTLKKPSSSLCVSLSLSHYLCYWFHYLCWIN